MSASMTTSRPDGLTGLMVGALAALVLALGLVFASTASAATTGALTSSTPGGPGYYFPNAQLDALADHQIVRSSFSDGLNSYGIWIESQDRNQRWYLGNRLDSHYHVAFVTDRGLAAGFVRPAAIAEPIDYFSYIAPRR